MQRVLLFFRVSRTKKFNIAVIWQKCIFYIPKEGSTFQSEIFSSFENINLGILILKLQGMIFNSKRHVVLDVSMLTAVILLVEISALRRYST